MSNNKDEAIRQSQSLPAGAVAGVIADIRSHCNPPNPESDDEVSASYALSWADRLEQALQADAREKGEAFAYIETDTFNACSARDYAEAMRQWPDDYRDWLPVYLATQPAKASEKAPATEAINPRRWAAINESHEATHPQPVTPEDCCDTPSFCSSVRRCTAQDGKPHIKVLRDWRKGDNVSTEEFHAAVDCAIVALTQPVTPAGGEVEPEWQPTPCPTCQGFCGDNGPSCAEQRSEAYDMLDRYLRNNMGDDDYAEYSAALEVVYAVPALQADAREKGEAHAVEFFTPDMVRDLAAKSQKEAQVVGTPVAWAEDTPYGRGYRFANELALFLGRPGHHCLREIDPESIVDATQPAQASEAVDEVSSNGLKCEAGFVYANGIHTPTVLISFQPGDWTTRDKFMAGINRIASSGQEKE